MYFLNFITFGVLGWGIDTLYRSITERKYHPGTYIPFFSIIYATGGIALITFFRYSTIGIPAEIIIGGTAMTTLELTGGILSTRILKKRLWNYSKNPFNFKGHIDLIHTLYWFMLTAALRLIYAFASL